MSDDRGGGESERDEGEEEDEAEDESGGVNGNGARNGGGGEDGTTDRAESEDDGLVTDTHQRGRDEEGGEPEDEAEDEGPDPGGTRGGGWSEGAARRRDETGDKCLGPEENCSGLIEEKNEDEDKVEDVFLPPYPLQGGDCGSKYAGQGGGECGVLFFSK